MRIRWLPKSRHDLRRLYDFLVDVNPAAAARRIDDLLDTVETLLEYPRSGHVLDRFAPQEVRSWFIGDYEVRYERKDGLITILRIWQTREDR